MARKNLPGYLQHKASGQAIVVIHGKTIYLGKYRSKASREEYEKIIGEYIANGKKLPPTRGNGSGISIEELVIKFLEWAESYYVKSGKLTDTFARCKITLAPLVAHYGSKSVSEFGPLSLVFIRDKWVESGIARETINRRVDIIRQAFRWGVTHELVAADILHALEAVDSLKEGRTIAPEYEEIEPVADEIVEKTLLYLPPMIADMVRIQRLVGMRPQDVRNMRLCNIDRTGDVWKYKPFTHKTEHHGKKRELAIGPRAQKILIPYLISKQDDPESFLFCPADSEGARKLEMRKNRKTPIQPSQQQRNADRKKNPKRKYREQYSKDSYNRAIERACIKAGTTTTITGLSKSTEYEFQVRALNDDGDSEWSKSVFVVTDGVSTFHKRRRVFRCIGKTTDSVTLAWASVNGATGYEIQYRQSGAATWTNVFVSPIPQWSPNQLRHSAGTEVRDKYGLEHAQAVLGHSNAKVTEIYAKASFEKAAQVAREIKIVLKKVCIAEGYLPKRQRLL